MLQWIEREAKKCGSSVTEVTQFVFPALFNTIGNIVLSKDLVHPHSRMASQFYLECLGCPNVSDFFPTLRWLDLQGLRRKTDHVLGKTLKITSGFVKDRVEQRHQNEERSVDIGKDFLDVLLDFKGTGKDGPAKLSEGQISILLVVSLSRTPGGMFQYTNLIIVCLIKCKTMVQDMFIAAADTTTTSVEWAMSEILAKVLDGLYYSQRHKCFCECVGALDGMKEVGKMH